MSGLTNSRDRFHALGPRRRRTADVRVCKHVIFATGGARFRILSAMALRKAAHLLFGKR